MDIDETIDKKLKEVYEADDYTKFASLLYEYPPTNTEGLIDQTMIEIGLIKKEKDVRIITAFGLEVSKLGGWKKYQQQQSQKAHEESLSKSEIEQLTKKQLQLSIREMQVNFTQIKYWWAILLVTTIASAVLGALFQALF